MSAVLVMDIDGTIAPYSSKGCSRTYRAHLADITVPEVITDFLQSLKCDAFWLTYRSGFIPHTLQNAARIRNEIVLDESEDKYDVLLAWAKEHDEYDKIVWVDDDYDSELEAQITEELASFGVTLFHSVPNGHEGLTWANRQEIVEELGLEKAYIPMQ